jgi:hypothetical protein
MDAETDKYTNEAKSEIFDYLSIYHSVDVEFNSVYIIEDWTEYPSIEVANEKLGGEGYTLYDATLILDCPSGSVVVHNNNGVIR